MFETKLLQHSPDELISTGANAGMKYSLIRGKSIERLLKHPRKHALLRVAQIKSCNYRPFNNTENELKIWRAVTT